MNIKNIVRDGIKSVISPRTYTHLRYFISHRRFLNMNNPVSYTEKIQYRKLKTPPEPLVNFVDKISVKDIIKNVDTRIYVPRTIAVFDKVCEDDIYNLNVKSFVIKTNHGGGGNFVDVVDDISNVNVEELVKKYNSLVDVKTGAAIDEYFYDLIEPKIFIEENLNERVCGTLLDYKFHIFDGKVEFVQINKRQTKKDYTMTLVDRDFLKLPFTLDSRLSSEQQRELEKPELFETAVSLAEVVCAGFNYVRLDFYITDDLIIFGELTFCPSSGWSKVKPEHYDFKLGHLWNLNEEIN